MGKLKDDSNFKIYGWMPNKLKLKGNELLIYAIIYSFSQNDNGNGVFNANLQYLEEWTNIANKNVRNCLKNLLEKQLIIKIEDNYSIRKPNVYKINKRILDDIKNNQTGYETYTEQGTKRTQTGYETYTEQGTKRTQTGRTQTGYETYTNNNIINTIDNNIINRVVATEEEKEKILRTYTDINPRFTQLEIQMLEEDIKIYPTKWIMEAMRRAVANGKYKLAYIEGILISWQKNGYDEVKNKDGSSSNFKRSRLYKQHKVETIEDAERKFANETSGWG